MENEHTFQQSEKESATTQLTSSPKESGGASASPPPFQLQSSPANSFNIGSSAPVIQATLAGTHGWMNSVDPEKLIEQIGGTLLGLWKDLKKIGVDIYLEEGSPSFDFTGMELSLPKDWFAAIKTYVDEGTQSDLLGRALSGLTHEMSHAHDRLVAKDSPKGKSKENDDYLTAVLRTELKAWWLEAKSSIENKRVAGIERGDENNELVNSWLAVYVLAKMGTGMETMLAIKDSSNIVLGRLKLYYNKNKTTETPLLTLLEDPDSGLKDQLFTHAFELRSMLKASDEAILGIVGPFMG